MHVDEGRLDRGDGVELAWIRRSGQGPTVVFLPGFASDMQGSKALALDGFCAGRGQAMLRLDYSGHGASGGAFRDGSIGRWCADARAVIEEACPPGPMVLVGSSMGGWIALLLARAIGHRIAALVGIAAAPDFTERLIWAAMGPGERAALQREGVLHLPSQYGTPMALTMAMVEDGRSNLVLEGPIAYAGPVRLLHGQHDADVPWEFSLRIAERVASNDVQVVLVKDGDHRLSRDADLALLRQTVGAMLDGMALTPDAGGSSTRAAPRASP